MNNFLAVLLNLSLITSPTPNAKIDVFSQSQQHTWQAKKQNNQIEPIFNQKEKFKLSSPTLKNHPSLIVINISTQKLQLFEKGKLKKSYLISTSKRGPGQIVGSKKTPLGLHKICEKIGAGAPQYAIFKARRFTGYVWPTDTPRHLHQRDYIVTRILRLEGLEAGLNKGHNNAGHTVDSKDRAIYIHGTTMEWKLGSPATIGCIHMGSQDVTRLFDQVAVGTLVYITS